MKWDTRQNAETDMLFDCLAIFSLLVMLLLMKPLINIFPSLMACLVRSKESINLDSSVKLARDRNILTVAMVIPFCLVACRFRLYGPSFLEGLGANAVLGVYFAVFAAYVALRRIGTRVFRPKRIPSKIYSSADTASFNFFIILALVLLASGGILDLINVSDETTRCAMLWESAVIYTLFLLRKTQILSSNCSVFTAFLYLCALEMIPTGILIVSDVIFS